MSTFIGQADLSGYDGVVGSNKRTHEDDNENASTKRVKTDGIRSVHPSIAAARKDKNYFRNRFMNSDGTHKTHEELDALYLIEEREYEGKAYSGVYVRDPSTKGKDGKLVVLEISGPQMLAASCKKMGPTGNFGMGKYDAKEYSAAKQNLRCDNDPQSLLTPITYTKKNNKKVVSEVTGTVEEIYEGAAQELEDFNEAMKNVNSWILEYQISRPECQTAIDAIRANFEKQKNKGMITGYTEDDVKDEFSDQMSQFSCCRKTEKKADGTLPAHFFATGGRTFVKRVKRDFKNGNGTEILDAVGNPITDFKYPTYPSEEKPDPDHVINIARSQGLSWNPVPVIGPNGDKLNDAPKTNEYKRDPARQLIKIKTLVRPVFTLKPIHGDAKASTGRAVLKAVIVYEAFTNPNENDKYGYLNGDAFEEDDDDDDNDKTTNHPLIC